MWKSCSALVFTFVMLATPLLGGGGVGMLLRRPRLGWLGVAAVVAFLALNEPIIDALRPDWCEGQFDCPDPNTHVFGYLVLGYALTAGTVGYVIGANRARATRRPTGGVNRPR